MPVATSELSRRAVDLLAVLLRELPQYPAVALWRCWETALIGSLELALPVLDLGCGSGRILELILGETREGGRTAAVVGLDISEEFARLALPRSLYDTVLVADGRAIPFVERAFGSAVSVCVLEHIPEVEQCIREVARVLRPGGTVVFSVPTPRLCEMAAETHPENPEEYVAALNERVEHRNVWGPKAWQDAVEQAGLRVSEVTGFMPAEAARAWFGLYDWTVRPIRGRGALYRLAGPRLRRFGLGRVMAQYWFARLRQHAATGVTCEIDEASAILIVARKP